MLELRYRGVTQLECMLSGAGDWFVTALPDGAGASQSLVRLLSFRS